MLDSMSLIFGVAVAGVTIAGVLIYLGSLRRDIEQSAKADVVKALHEKHEALATDLRPRVSDLEKACKAIEIMASAQRSEVMMLADAIRRIDGKLDKLLDRQRGESTVDG